MNRKAQSTLEYTVVIAMVIGALLAMQAYVKRGMQGKLRESADAVGEQYSAGNTTAKYTTSATAQTAKETFGIHPESGAAKGTSYYTVVTPSTVTRSAEGADAEIITQKLSDEDLIE